MRLEKAVFHNVGPFSDFELDLTSLGDARLVAIIGPNGAGKSFSLEAAIAGASYRQMPTQGKLIARATARDSFIESRLVNGKSWTIRHKLDAASRKGETVVLGADDAPAYEGTNVSRFDEWSAKHLLPSDVLFATIFSAQQSEGFIGLGSSERISVILQATGVARLERMAEHARKRASDAKRKHETAQARLADERERGGDVDETEASLCAYQAAAQQADTALAAARVALETAEAEQRKAAEAEARAQEVRQQRAGLTAELEAARARLADLEERARNNRALLGDGDAIRAAAAEIEGARREAEELGEQVRATETKAAERNAELQRLRKEAADADRAREAALDRAERAKERLALRAQVEAATGQLEQLRADVAASEAMVELAGEELEKLKGQRLAGLRDRIVGLRCSLKNIAAGDTDNDRTEARLGLRRDDDRAQEAQDRPSQLAALEARLLEARSSLVSAQRNLAEAERVAARASEMASAEQDLRAADAEASELAKARDAATQSANLLAADMTTAAKFLEEFQRRHGLARQRVVEIERVAARLPKLEAAEARLAELEPQTEAARAELERIGTALEALPQATPVPPMPDVESHRRDLAGCERTARASHGAVAKAEHALEQARASAGRAADLELAARGIEAELGDWNRLASDLGRDGIQSAEVDSAGPELTELTNDLLRHAYGTRFTVSIETQRASADGRRLIDECRVSVIDTVRGTEKEAREHSGGERVILAEAISLGLTMLACRRAGLSGVTLVRDESGAALDPAAGRAYIAMLRRAAELVDADKVLFVTHTPELQEMADARIEVG